MPRGYADTSLSIDRTQARAGEPLKPGPHKRRGVGAGFVPGVLDPLLVDCVEQVSNEEAALFAEQEAILAGIACGAATAGAVRITQQTHNAGMIIVAVPPDPGERYLSIALFESLFDGKGIAA